MSSVTQRPELVVDGYPRRRPRWIELATSADHKDIGRILITGAFGFLFIAAIELLLMRLQLSVPDNTFLSPVGFNRMLSEYGATAVFFFAIPLVFGLFYYVAPLQVGTRTTALPRLGQLGMALWATGALAFVARMAWLQRRASTAMTRAKDGSHWIGAHGPALIGLWPARLVLPPDFEQRFDAAQRPLVLAHEAVHRSRFDNHWNALAAEPHCPRL